MAFQLNFTNDQDINMPETYWRISSFSVDVNNKNANWQFTGYKSKQARDNGKQPIGSRRYNSNGAEFESYYAKVIDKELNPAEVFYTITKGRQELLVGYEQKEVTGAIKQVIQVPSADPDVTVEQITTETITELVDDTNKPIRQSFFKGALDV